MKLRHSCRASHQMPFASSSLPWAWRVLFLVLATAACGVRAFVDPMRHNVFVVTPQSFDTMISKHRNADGVALLLHFSSQQPRQKKIIDESINKVATDLKGIVRVGAVDCELFSRFCRDNHNPDLKTPVLVLYPPNPLPPKLIEDVNNVEAVTTAATKVVSGRHVVMLTDAAGEAAFLSPSQLAVPKVVFFSAKAKKPPVLFRALANHFQDRLAFAFVPTAIAAASSDPPPLLAKVEAPYPKVAMWRVADKGGVLRAPEIYPSKQPLTFDALHDWLNPHAETFVKGGGFTDSGNSGGAAAKPWLTELVPEMTGPSHKDVCFGHSDLCGLLLTDGPITDELRTMVERVAAARGNGAVRRWSWLDVGREAAFKEVFGVGEDSGSSASLPAFVVVNPKKFLRFAKAEGVTDAAAIEQLLERVEAGATYTRVKGNKLPTFASSRVAGGAAGGRGDEL